MKKSLICLSLLVLTQAAFAQKIIKRQNEAKNRVWGGSLDKIDRSDIKKPENLHGARNDVINSAHVLDKEQTAEKNELISKYVELAKSRQIEDAIEVAAILDKKFSYKVDRSLLEFKLTEEEMKIIAKYNAKYDYLMQRGDLKSASILDSEIFNKYGVHLVFHEKVLSDKDREVIAGAQQKYNDYWGRGDKDTAYKIDAEIYNQFAVHLVSPRVAIKYPEKPVAILEPVKYETATAVPGRGLASAQEPALVDSIKLEAVQADSLQPVVKQRALIQE